MTVSDAVVTRVVNGATVLLNTDTGRYFTLDEVGGRTWLVLTSSESIREAQDRLLAEFAVEPDDLMRDLQQLIANLTEHGLVQIEHE